ncbi:MAG: SRPBCC family protein [Myxococcota bacterium]
MQSIEVQREIPAPREAVWSLLTDSSRCARWAGFHEVVVRQQGDPPPEGLGAIRVLRGGGIALEEEITAYDPPRLLGYRLTAGLPIRDHRAAVLLETRIGGTRLTWTARFRSPVPLLGSLVRMRYRRTLERLTERLAAELGTEACHADDPETTE